VLCFSVRDCLRPQSQLSDVHSVFNSVLDAVTQYGFYNDFLSLLHHVLIIPSGTPLGTGAWSAVLDAVRKVVLGDDEVRRALPQSPY
jgi:hypothetical protein